ncbi:MAG: amino acid permease [Chloroflexi bacterium]|nr:amino acid permease [Chloroflexota bacterium]
MAAGSRPDGRGFDLTNIVIGAIVGADIYIASSITAGLVGPFALVVWLIAGVMATVLAIVFAYCSFYVPRAGGPFAYSSEAFNPFVGFVCGWSMWIAEIMALPVFALAFVNYLGYFANMTTVEKGFVKAGFLFLLTAVNIYGVKAAGLLNDALTILKLLPLLVLIVVGLSWMAYHHGEARANFSPFLPHGVHEAPTALVLIFWAYVGFELGTLPASEVADPKRTIPRAIVRGIVIVTLFYLLTNFVVYGVNPSPRLAATAVPLVLTGSVLMGSVGAHLMSVGAMISVSGSDESSMLSTARLSHAMAAEGLLPRPFAWVHRRTKTPVVALAAQGSLAFLLSLYSGIPRLISFSVVCLGFSFLVCCLSLAVLQRRSGEHLPGVHLLPWIGVPICLYLLYAAPHRDQLAGGIVIVLGAAVYVPFAPKVGLPALQKELHIQRLAFLTGWRKEVRFLGGLFHMLRRLFGAV